MKHTITVCGRTITTERVGNKPMKLLVHRARGATLKVGKGGGGGGGG